MKTIFLSLFAAFFFCSAIRAAGNDTVPRIYRAEMAYRAEASTGEGAIWHEGRQSLFWVDIEGKTLYEFLPGRKECRQWTFDRMVSTVVPETDGTVLVALRDEIVRVHLDDGHTDPVAPVPDRNGTLRCNDGKCDPAGRFWIGTMRLNAPEGSAALYCLDSDGSLSTKITGVNISNGIVWTSDKKYMYYTDTPTGRIVRYRYDNTTGDIVYDGIAVTVAEGTGSPDGMTIDSDDNLWVAQWGGSGVYCYDPRTGRLLAKVEVPALNVASCAFGGKDRDILYITTARAGLSPDRLERYPLSGSLFYCRPAAKGVPAAGFGGK